MKLLNTQYNTIYYFFLISREKHFVPEPKSKNEKWKELERLENEYYLQFSKLI